MNYLFLILFLVFFGFSNDAFTTEVNSKNQGKICSFNECYTIISELGEGAFGKVYHVENSKKVPFALKRYKVNDYGADPLGDAAREFQRGQLLNHPNIIKSFDLFSSNNDPDEATTNLVLNLVEGKTLYHTLQGSLSGEGALVAAGQFVKALQYALSLELMHLDLHNNNVMIDKDSNIALIDLASFFSFDEIFHFVQQEPQLMEPPQVLMGVRLKEDAQSNLRMGKLKKFFNENPQLFNQIKQIQEEKNSVAPRFKMEKGNFHKEASKVVCDEKSILQANYFNNLAEMSIDLISKSTLNREKQIDLRAKIKTIIWNYEADVNEGKCFPLNVYLEELIRALE